MKRIAVIFGMAVLLLTGTWEVKVCAADGGLTEEFLDELELDEIDASFRELQENGGMRFTDAVNSGRSPDDRGGCPAAFEGHAIIPGGWKSPDSSTDHASAYGSRGVYKFYKCI